MPRVPISLLRTCYSTLLGCAGKLRVLVGVMDQWRKDSCEHGNVHLVDVIMIASKIESAMKLFCFEKIIAKYMKIIKPPRDVGHSRDIYFDKSASPLAMRYS